MFASKASQPSPIFATLTIGISAARAPTTW